MLDLNNLIQGLQSKPNPKDGNRICIKCDLEKSLDQFNVANRPRADGTRQRRHDCKDCQREYDLIYREKHKPTLQRRDSRRRYQDRHGLDFETASALSNPDNRIGTCPLCQHTTSLVLDHDHITDQRRDLICGACNKMLGFARESLDTLYNAIAYIKKHRGV